jgi:subtilisin family serine protease
VLGALVLLGAVVAVAGGAAPSKLAFTPLTADATFVGDKSVSGALAQTDPSLLGRTGSNPINVMIKYDVDATASYTGGVAGYAATSPAVTGKTLEQNKAAAQAYDRHVENVSNGISAAIEKAVPAADVGRTFTTVYGGVSATVPADSVSDLLKVDGVAAVQKDTLQQPQDDNTDFIGAKAVWPSLGGSSKAGSNVIVGVIDTGVWPEHPMLSPAGVAPPTTGKPPWGCEFGDGSDSAHLGPAFSCNSKLIGAYAFTKTYMANVGADANEFCNPTTKICSARDSEGHGTHTTTTAAGDCVSSAVLYGVQRGPVCGIAPGAHVIMYRVCLAQGCFSSDSIDAVAQAIDDGVDVINFSISGGGNPYTDAVELAFRDAYNAGISVNASAGNSGPAAATTDHGGPWVTTVGASTGPRSFLSTLHLAASGGATLDLVGNTLTNGITTPTPVILAESIPGEDVLCQTKLTTPAQIAAATGKIVACERGTNARVDKGFNLAAGHAAGMILYNPTKMDVETDNHWLPAIHIDGPDTAFLDFVNGHSGVTATWSQGTPTPTTPDVMAAFSSRGPQADFVKPDVTAPGVQVLAGMTPQPTGSVNGPPGNLYQAIAGTSMSSPHAAGVSALVKSAHPDWTPGMIKSALMTSAVTNVVEEDGTTPATPFDDGAGSIRADRAVNPTLVFDESFADFVASDTDPLHRIDLNIASVDAPTMTGLITTKRTATNVSGEEQDLKVSVDSPAGATIYVSDKAPGPNGPKSDDLIRLRKNGTTDIWITISAPELADGQYFGRITLDPQRRGANAVTIPVAFDKRQGNVTLSHDCAPTTFPRKTGVAHCSATVTNLGSVAANVNLTVTNLDKGKLDFTNISAPATSIKNGDGVQWSGSLTPALAPAVTSITAGSDPDIGGYFPLASAGIGKISAGDDTMTNFTVPAFKYGTETYTSIGVGSNGTLVVGGGSAADATPLPQTFPNPARPNNVIAPFWTDLNPAAAGLPTSSGIRVATAEGGGKRWIIVDWGGIPNFSGGPLHSFEVWIETSTLSDGTPTTDGERISIEYGTTGAGDPGTGVNYGAENRDGSSGQNITPAPANGSEYTVNLAPPVPGGTATITYDASSRQAGTYKTVASMTSDVTPGTTQVVKTLTVTG